MYGLVPGLEMTFLLRKLYTIEGGKDHITHMTHISCIIDNLAQKLLILNGDESKTYRFDEQKRSLGFQTITILFINFRRLEIVLAKFSQ